MGERRLLREEPLGRERSKLLCEAARAAPARVLRPRSLEGELLHQRGPPSSSPFSPSHPARSIRSLSLEIRPLVTHVLAHGADYVIHTYAAARRGVAAPGRTAEPATRSRSTGRPGRTAKPSRTARFPRTESALELISPELVLVDPELARIQRARLFERTPPQVLADAATPRTGGKQAARPRLPLRARSARRSWRDALNRPGKHVALVLVGISLMTNGMLTAAVLSGSPGGQPAPTLVVTKPPSYVPVAPTSRGNSSGTQSRSRPAEGSTVKPRQSAPETGKRVTPQSAILGETSAMVERRILALVVQSPTGKLPSALIDRKTGLAKNNLQAVCRLSKTSSFLCVIRPAQHKPREGLYVRYRPARTGGGAFTWYRYRNG